MPHHWDFEALDGRGYLPAAGVEASSDLFPRLVQFAADNGGTAIDRTPLEGLVHRDDFHSLEDDFLVDAVQLQDGDHQITVGSQEYTYTSDGKTYTTTRPFFSITALRNLPDCDVKVEGLGSSLIWGNPIEPDDKGDRGWPRRVKVWSTAHDRNRVRHLLDEELLDLLTTDGVEHGLRIRGGLAMLADRISPFVVASFHSRERWEQRARLIEALVVRNAASSR